MFINGIETARYRHSHVKDSKLIDIHRHFLLHFSSLSIYINLRDLEKNKTRLGDYQLNIFRK